MSKDNLLTIDEILENKPRKLKIPGIGNVLVKDPSNRDIIDARKEAREHELWDQMTDAEKRLAETNMLALKMLVEPSITKEQYYESPSPKLSNILDSIIMDYNKRLNELVEPRRKEIKAFLDQLKEKSLRTSS